MKKLFPASLSKDFLAQNRKVLRRFFILLLIFAFFFWLGSVSPQLGGNGYCGVYY